MRAPAGASVRARSPRYSGSRAPVLRWSRPERSSSLAAGSGLIEVSDGFYSLGDGWIAGTLGLLVLAFLLGALGGQRPKRARLLAARLAGDGEPAAEALRTLLDDRRSRAFNYAAGTCVVAALVIMVWKPGL
jgi:uncharacterized membrane protein